MGVLGELFLTFVKIGLFTFGGGYAMISVIEHICVEDKQWISHDDMMNITVIAESTPGPVAINCATFVGYKKKGIGGAIVATLGMLIPSFTIIFVISMFLDHFLEIGIIANAFKGIKLAVGILIVDAALKMIRKMQKKVYICVILICSTVMMLAINIFSLTFSYLIIMLVAGMISLGLFAGKSRKESEL
ncbi:MAG: chromate transporter [Lachnospiraceae bacterium]|nr:chromate transporter [Lachnospiraceae bacterium]